MPITTNTLAQWQTDRVATPDYALPGGYFGEPREVNLLTNVTYDAKVRDQGHTGSCWMWGCQAVLWLDYARQYPAAALALTNGFSVQFISSYLHVIDGELNMGGTPPMFKSFFEGFGYAVPWDNKNARWTDGKGYVVTRPAEIYTRPNVPIYSMELLDLKTFQASTNEAIALIKSVLDSGHALHFNLMLADGAEWDKFMNFWGKTSDTEETLFTNFVSGKTLSLETGGAHMMACVGYNDTDPDPAKHYWLFLNSWSTGDNDQDTRRPHGTWRLPMHLDYGAHTVSGIGEIKAPMFEWGILNTTFTNEVRKDFDCSGGIRLEASHPEQTQIPLAGPVTEPGVIGDIYSAAIYVNERYYSCTPAKGTWKSSTTVSNLIPSGNVFEYNSHPGLEPVVRMLVDTQAKTWSTTITQLTPDDCRLIDLHRGLYCKASFQKSAEDDWRTLCPVKAVAYDELDGLAQLSGPFSSAPKAGTLRFTGPASGVEIALGSTCVIEWTQQGLDGKLLTLELAGFDNHHDRAITIADMIPVEAGRFEWVVPRDLWCVTNQALTATLGEMLKFTGPQITLVPSTAPWLTVRSPAGGEQWTNQATRVVSWEGGNLSGNVTVELLHNGEVVAGSARTVAAAAGRLAYTLPGGLAAGDYALRLTVSGLSVTSAAFAVTGTPTAPKPWTVLIYLDADNNLEPDQIVDFRNIAKVGSSSNINVLVQMDRVPGYHVGYDNWYGAKRYYMTNGITPTIANAAQDLGEVNFAQPETLTDFINWGVENYPAEHYFLVLADHGNGWAGALWEFTPNGQYNVPQPMTVFEQALTNAVAPMTIVGFDTCLMAAVEAAYQLRHSGAEVYIGSQYMETKGWAYPEFLQELEQAKGQIGPRALAARVCDLSVNKYSPRDPAALTAVDLASLAPLAGTVAGFADAMRTNPADRTLIRAQADAVATHYHQAIIHHAANQQTELLTTGLNIDFPLLGAEADYAAATLDFTGDAHWLDFLRAYTNGPADSWIGEVRNSLGSGNPIDLLRFVNGIRPPDDAVALSVSMAGKGEVEGLPVNENLLLHKGDRLQLVGRGAEASGTMSPATHFVRWWGSAGVTFSNELTAATNSVTVTDNAVIIAYFSENQSAYKVTVSAIGGGTVNGQAEAFELTVAPGGNAPAVFAVADAGFVFSGWGGDVRESANPLVVSNVISDLTLYGFFWPARAGWANSADTNWWQTGATQFTLVSPQQLAGLARLVNLGTDSFVGKVVQLGANLDLAGKAWTAIGTEDHPYGGSFNGQGHTINGLIIEKTADDLYQGLFGLVSSTNSVVLEGLRLTNTTIVAGAFVGGLAGRVESVAGSIVVRDCANAGSVWGYGSLVSGLAGELATGAEGGSVTVSNCLNGARVNGTADVGGVAGRVLAQANARLANCANEGALSGEGTEIGGVVGAVMSLSATMTLETCRNSGPVTADGDEVGGVAGKATGSESLINGCQNSGTITVTGAGHQHAGGVAGLASALMPKFANCRNTAEVHGHNLVGGVAGVAAVSLQNCSNEGLVEGADRVGGVAGAVHGSGTASLDNCLNVGPVSGSGRVGGVAGQIACESASALTSTYFLKTADVNPGLAFAGEMIPATNLSHCATLAGLDGVLTPPGFGDKLILANALNAWVGENPGGYYWSTNRNGALVYPYLDPSLTEVVVTFRANGGVFTGGYNTTNRIYTLGQPYGSFPANPLKTNQAFVGWWHLPEPGAAPAKLLVDLSASPSIVSLDAYWSATTHTQTPLPISVETLAVYYPQVATMTEAQINALANSQAANHRDKLWELLFLGLDPTKSGTSPDKVFVYMTVNPLQIHTVPATPIEGTTHYSVWGKQNLTDADWTNLGAPGAPVPAPYRFFRAVGN